MSDYLLGIDNGSTVSKAALFSLDGRELATSSRNVTTIEPGPGLSERDADRLWDDVADVIRDVLARTGIDPADIRGIACSGHGNGLCLIDAEGRPVRNNIYATDSRAQPYVDRWQADGVAEAASPSVMLNIRGSGSATGYVAVSVTNQAKRFTASWALSLS